MYVVGLQNAPQVFHCTGHFATCDGSRERVLGYTNLVVDVSIGKVIGTVCHGTHDDHDVLVLRDRRQIFAQSDGGCIPREG